MTEQQPSGFMPDVQEVEYPDPAWVEVYEPAHLSPATKEGEPEKARRVVRITRKSFESLYADRGYELVEPKKK